MRPSSRDEFVIAIICALTREAEAVEDLFDETYDRLGEYYGKQSRDDNAYINGRVGKHNVVLCYMPGMGKGSAASVASSLKISYSKIEVALIVGICGGAPFPLSGEEIFLGDVIISDSVVQYDFGRQYPSGFEKKTGVKDTLGRPNLEIRSKLAGLKARQSRRDLQEKLSRHLQALQESQLDWHRPTSVSDVLYEASYQHKHYDLQNTCLCLVSTSDDICKEAIDSTCTLLNCDLAQVCRLRADDNSPRVHIGTVASADTVMKSGEHRDRLVQSEGVVGFEMEGAGVWDNISCIIIKGVCDYADSHKNKEWQAYAAATAAATAKAFLEYWAPNIRESLQPTASISPFQGIYSPKNSPVAGGGIGNIIYNNNTYYHGQNQTDNPLRLYAANPEASTLFKKRKPYDLTEPGSKRRRTSPQGFKLDGDNISDEGDTSDDSGADCSSTSSGVGDEQGIEDGTSSSSEDNHGPENSDHANTDSEFDGADDLSDGW